MLVSLVVFVLSSYKLMQLIRLRNTRIEIPIENNIILENEVYPVRLEIPENGIYLPIYQSYVNNGVWEYSEQGISYLKGSPLPGDYGNSILYGHNWPNLLGNLKKAKKGDVLKIHLSNNEIREFRVVDTYIVTPDQTHILSPTETPVVTLYTCTGFLDSKRLVVVYSPVASTR